MTGLDRVKAAFEAFAAGRATPEQHSAVREAIAAGQVQVVSGERAVQFGRDANGATVITGDRNVVFSVGPGEVAALLKALAGERRRVNQLPTDLPDFEGRTAEIETLEGALRAGGQGAISAIGGMGGVGKSALALHVAHRLGDAAPDGRIFVDMGGISPQPLTPIAAMAIVIQALLPTAQVPAKPQLAQSLYRSCLDGRRILLLLDNAQNTEQVAPLLEWRAPSTLIIITSRRTITGPGVKNISLEEMKPDEARALLSSILGKREATENELNKLAERCGRLPLALRVAGTFLALNRDWTVSEYLDGLADQKTRLAWLRIEDDVRLDVHAVLGFSARQLAEDKPDLFERWQMLSVFPQSFDRAAVAAVWGAPESHVRPDLSELVRRSMVLFDKADGRYRLHDLMRDVARLPLKAEDEATVRQLLDEASARHAAHYCAVLRTADDLYQKGAENVLGGLALYDHEQRNIMAGQTWAVERMDVSDGAAKMAAQYAIWGFQVLGLRLHPRQWIAWLDAQLRVCRRFSHRLGEGWALSGLGWAYHALGEARRALQYHRQHLKVARASGYRRGESDALDGMGIAHRELGELRQAIKCHKESLAIARELGNRQLEGAYLGSLGIAYDYLGGTQRGIECFEQHLRITQETGDRQGEGRALGNLGNAYHRLGDARRAVEYYDQSLPIAQQLGYRRGQATTLGNLGAAWFDSGEVLQAIEYYVQSLAIAREMGDRRGEARALYNWAEALERLGENAGALEKAEAALAIFEQIEDPNAAAARALVERLRGR